MFFFPFCSSFYPNLLWKQKLDPDPNIRDLYHYSALHWVSIILCSLVCCVQHEHWTKYNRHTVPVTAIRQRSQEFTQLLDS